MTTKELLEKARKEAVRRTENLYKEICEGICDYKKEIEEDKSNGEYQKELERQTLKVIYEVRRVIYKTKLLTEQEKKQVLYEIDNCEEMKKSKKRIADIFVNHFVKYSEVYLK